MIFSIIKQFGGGGGHPVILKWWFIDYHRNTYRLLMQSLKTFTKLQVPKWGYYTLENQVLERKKHLICPPFKAPSAATITSNHNGMYNCVYLRSKGLHLLRKLHVYKFHQIWPQPFLKASDFHRRCSISDQKWSKL